MDCSEDEQFVGRRHIPGVTQEAVLAELAENPLIVKFWKKNTQEVQQRLIDTMMRKPSASDCPGYIYGFRNLAQYDASATSYNIKMGRTKRQVPQQRIFEWERDDNHQYVEIFTIRSEFNMKLEALVHLVFAYARKTMVINGKNRIEWFTFDEKIPTAAVVNLVNLAMEKIHQSECKQPEELSRLEREQIIINNSISSYNEALKNALDYLKSAIYQYAKRGDTKTKNLLKEVLHESSMENTKKLFEKIIETDLIEQFEEKLVFDLDEDKEIKEKIVSIDAKFLIKALENVLDKVKKIEQQEKLGIKFNYILGRIKEAVYFGFKGSEELEEIFKDYQKSEKIEEYKKKVSSQEKVQKVKPKKSEKEEKQQVYAKEVDSNLTTQDNNDFEKSKRSKKTDQKEEIVATSQQSKSDEKNKTKLSELYQYLKNVQQGTTVLNVCDGDFSINCSKRVSHNIIILAKSIKIYDDWNITFSSTASEKILNLVIMGKEIINIEKLKIPKNSANGFVSVLSVDEKGELFGLDDTLKLYPHKLKSQFYEGIKKIFNNKIK